MKYTGVWIPLVTPFLDGVVDYESLDRLVDHYAARGVSGLVPLATTGEVPTIVDDEYFAVLERNGIH